MKNSEVINLKVQLHIDQVETSINRISNGIVGLQETISSVGSQLSNVFHAIQMSTDMLTASMRQMAEPIIELASGLKLMAESDIGALISELIELNHILNDTFEQQEKHQIQDLVSDYVSSGVNAAQLGLDIYKLIDEKNTKSKGGNKPGIKVKVRKKGTNSKTASSKSSVSGIAAGGIGYFGCHWLPFPPFERSKNSAG